MITSDTLKELTSHLGYAHFCVGSSPKKPIYIKIQEWADKEHGTYWKAQTYTVCKMKLPFVENPEYKKFEDLKFKMQYVTKGVNNWLNPEILEEMKKLGCEFTIALDRRSITYTKTPAPILFDMTEDEMKAAIENGCKWKMKAENNKLLRELNILD